MNDASDPNRRNYERFIRNGVISVAPALLSIILGHGVFVQKKICGNSIVFLRSIQHKHRDSAARGLLILSFIISADPNALGHGLTHT